MQKTSEKSREHGAARAGANACAAQKDEGAGATYSVAGLSVCTLTNPGAPSADRATHQNARALRSRALRRSPLASNRGGWDGVLRPALNPVAVARPRGRPRSRDRGSAPHENV